MLLVVKSKRVERHVNVDMMGHTVHTRDGLTWNQLCEEVNFAMTEEEMRLVGICERVGCEMGIEFRIHDITSQGRPILDADVKITKTPVLVFCGRTLAEPPLDDGVLRSWIQSASKDARFNPPSARAQSQL